MAKITLTEDRLKNIVAESVKRVLNEISSDMLDRATDAAQEKGRMNQMNKFKYGANDKRKKEMYPDNDYVSMHISPKRDRCDVQDGNRRMTVYTDGRIKVVEDHTFSSNPDFGVVSWPLDNNNKLSSKISRNLARVIVKWCNKYLTPEGKEKLQGFDDWHNWVQL